MRDRKAVPIMDPAADGTGDTDTMRIMDALRRIVRELRVAAHGSEVDLGVSAAQLFVLRKLLADPGQSMSDLAQRTQTSQSSVSEVVARLVSRGFVARHPAASDRRRVELTLTPEGRSAAARAPRTIQERLLAGLDQLDQEQRHVLATGMDAWLSAAGLGDVPPTMFFEP
jgi:DNA-binding MarR family transcriptional regulator